MWQDGLVDLPAPWGACRQDGLHSFGLYRIEQPLPCPFCDEYRYGSHGVPMRRVVGSLWSWERDPRPPCVLGHERSQGSRASQRPRGELVGWLSAGRLPRDVSETFGRCDREPQAAGEFNHCHSKAAIGRPGSVQPDAPAKPCYGWRACGSHREL